MHEMSIAGAIFDAMNNELANHPGHRVAKVGVRIGEWAGVCPDSLQFCFESVQLQSASKPCAMEIEYRAASTDLLLSYFELEET